jgi:two-component system, chemotaxis family, protein-glutamate methylesterase/glutaminase
MGLTTEHERAAPWPVMLDHGQSPVRVLVADDSEVFRNVLSSLVAATPGFEVVGKAATGREALDLVTALDVQFVLMDVHMPEMDGIEAALWIRRQQPDVVVLLLTATRQATLDNLSLAIEDKRDLSPRWLAQFWQRHGPT